MSPISGSHFGTWAVFDLALGVERETIGTCILELVSELGIKDDVVRLIHTLQRSRLGLFVHEGNSFKDSCVLREMVTGERFQTVCPSGHLGKVGEQWLVRLVPPPAPSFKYHVAFTSPYVIELPSEKDWFAFFRRTLPKTKIADERAAYELLMKYGLGHNYWNQYIFEGYWEHTDSMISLLGLPDLAGSRPHSEEIEVERERLSQYYGAALSE